MSSSNFEDVQEFHAKVLGITDWFSTQKLLSERVHFMLEEVLEFDRARQDCRLVDMADALADVIYVALGTAHILDIPFDDIWKVVHAANMSKVAGQTKRSNAIDATKPEGWIAPEPEIRRLIEEHRNAKTK